MDKSCPVAAMDAVTAAYLQAIDCSADSSLEALVDGHNRHLRYCNAALFVAGTRPVGERVPVSVVPTVALVAQLRERGGICFEHIELQRHALLALGHRVTRHLVLPTPGPVDEAAFAARAFVPSHELLIVWRDDGRGAHLVDCGFGRNALRAPLPFDAGAQGEQVVRVLDETYSVTAVAGERDWRQLCVLTDPLPDTQTHTVVPLHRVCLAPIDSCAALVRATFLSPLPVRIRDDTYLVARCSRAEGREYLLLLRGAGAVHKTARDGRSASVALATWAEVCRVARERFGIASVPEQARCLL